jgi:serine phosphatase RsbU (regulator of sigma subunit)/tetratricopeptide (TPR) repeat protein
MMRLRLILLFFLLLAAGAGPLCAQGSRPPGIDSLAEVLRNSPGDSSTVKLLVKLGEGIARMDPDSGAVYADSAIRLAEKIGYRKGLASAYMIFANIKSANNQYKVALEYNLKALPLMEEFGNYQAQARIYRNIGSIYYGIHDLDNALKYYQKGLDLAEKQNVRSEMAGLLSNMGIILHSKLDYGKAMDYYIRALKVAEQNKDTRSRSYVLNSMGKLYFDIGKKDEHPQDFEQAINYYRKSYELKKELGDKKGMANTLGNMGEVQMERGKFTEAVDFYQKGYVLAVETDYKEWLESGTLNMATLYSQLGDYRNAFRFHQEYVAVKDTLSSINERKTMADMQDKFDDERRDRELEISKKKNELQESIVSRQRMTIWFASVGLVIVAVFAFFLFRSFREKQRTNLIIEEKNKNITDSIMYARRIQTAILPSRESMARVLPESFILYRPKDIVSGDFYFFTESRDRIIIAAADCTGHGVPGAFMSMIGNSLLNQIIKEKGITEPAAILAQLHQGVSNSLNQNKGTDANDGMDIGLCAIDRSTGKIEYAGANRNLYIRNASGLQEISGDKAPIGGARSETEVKFTNHVIEVKPGDTFYLSTDGYADQFGGPEGKKFRTRRFRELLASLHGKTMEEQRQELERTIAEWMGAHEQLDDILVVGVRL